MNNKIKLLLMVVFLVFAMAAIFNSYTRADADVNKCCINPDIDPTNTCRTDVEISEDTCCPAGSPTDCRQNLYKPQSCNELDECKTGCCCPEGIAFLKELQCRPADRFFTHEEYRDDINSSVTLDEFYSPGFCAERVCRYSYVPPTSGSCDNYVPSILPSPITGAIKGEKAIKIQWDPKCKDLADAGRLTYKVERCEGRNCNDFVGIGPPGLPIREVSVTDMNVEWETYYTYRVNASLGTVVYNSSPVVIYSGDVECWGVYDSNPFCVHASYYRREPRKDYPGLFTDPTSKQLKPKYTARWNQAFKCHVTENSINVLSPVLLECAKSYATVCVVANNQPACYSKSACKESGKPLGLNDLKTTCEAPNNYCFYDKSATVVDACYPCNETMGCYDYKSQQACLKDNCGIKNCAWNYTYPELGTGVCVDDSKSNCANCESKGTAGTGNLYAYNEIYDSCSGNLRQLRLNSLSTGRAPCIGAGAAQDCAQVTCRSYNADDCSQNDRCSIKVCDWFGRPSEGGFGCRKDAYKLDSKSNFDCDPGEAGMACERDYFAPQTTFSAVYELGSISRFDISILDKKSYGEIYSPIADAEKPDYVTYLCNNSPTCNFPFRFSAINSEVSRVATLSTLVSNGIIELDKTNVIRYYSIDPSKNNESVKEVSLFIPKPLRGLVIYIRKPGFRTTPFSPIEVEGVIFNSTKISELKIKVNSGSETDLLQGLSSQQIFSKAVGLDTTADRTTNVITVKAKDADNFETSSTITIVYDKKEPRGQITFE